MRRWSGMTKAPNKQDDKKPASRDEKTSPAGTHDKPELTDHHKTPGTGMLSDDHNREVDGPSG